MYCQQDCDFVPPARTNQDRAFNLIFILAIALLYFGLGLLVGFWIWGR